MALNRNSSLANWMLKEINEKIQEVDNYIAQDEYYGKILNCFETNRTVMYTDKVNYTNRNYAIAHKVIATYSLQIVGLINRFNIAGFKAEELGEAIFKVIEVLKGYLEIANSLEEKILEKDNISEANMDRLNEIKELKYKYQYLYESSTNISEAYYDNDESLINNSKDLLQYLFTVKSNIKYIGLDISKYRNSFNILLKEIDLHINDLTNIIYNYLQGDIENERYKRIGTVCYWCDFLNNLKELIELNINTDKDELVLSDGKDFDNYYIPCQYLYQIGKKEEIATKYYDDVYFDEDEDRSVLKSDYIVIKEGWVL